jgi:hypothetical protein
MKIGSRGSTANRKIFFAEQGIDCKRIVSANLVHGSRIKIVTKNDGGQIIDKTDGLITKEKELCLSVTAADCLPIYFYNPEFNIIGLVHDGWRGVVKNISGKIVKKLIVLSGEKVDEFLKKLCVFVGPHLRDCHFVVQNDIIKKFKKFPFALKISKKTDQDEYYISLEKIVIKQLLQAGVKRNNISSSEDCTYCFSKKYFSFRRDKPQNIEAQVAYIIRK